MAYRTEELELRLSWPTSSHRYDNYVVLTITDRASGMQVAEAELTGEQFSALLGGRGAKVPVDLISEERFHRVGKKYVHESLEVPEQFKRRSPAMHDGRREPSQGMQDYAREVVAGTDWEGARWSHHNFGWALTAFKWVAPE